jgi:hypothetical protein
MIASMVNGRIRIRDSKLKKGVFANEFQRHLSVVTGLKGISINTMVGSALLIYDTSITSDERIIKHIGRLLDVTQETEVPKGKGAGVNHIREFSLNRVNRRAVNIGMLASLAASLIALIAGSKALHAALGLVFLGFTAVHIFKNKNLLLA